MRTKLIDRLWVVGNASFTSTRQQQLVGVEWLELFTNRTCSTKGWLLSVQQDGRLIKSILRSLHPIHPSVIMRSEKVKTWFRMDFLTGRTIRWMNESSCSEHSSFDDVKEFLSRLKYHTISLVVPEEKTTSDKLIKELTGRSPDQENICNLFFKRK